MLFRRLVHLGNYFVIHPQVEQQWQRFGNGEQTMLLCRILDTLLITSDWRQEEF